VLPVVLPQLQGEYCWTVNVTANINTTAANNGTITLADWATANNIMVDAAPKTTYTACFYKRAEQAAATLTYDMCRTGKREYACRARRDRNNWRTGCDYDLYSYIEV
jgi:hypothetical protein